MLPSLSMTTPGAFFIRSIPVEPWANALWLTFITTLSTFISTSWTFSVTVAAARLSLSASISTTAPSARLTSTTSLYPIREIVILWEEGKLTWNFPFSSVVVQAVMFPSTSLTATVAQPRALPSFLSTSLAETMLSCLAADIVKLQRTVTIKNANNLFISFILFSIPMVQRYDNMLKTLHFRYGQMKNPTR